MSYFECIPDELLDIILSYLNYADFAMMSLSTPETGIMLNKKDKSEHSCMMKICIRALEFYIELLELSSVKTYGTYWKTTCEKLDMIIRGEYKYDHNYKYNFPEIVYEARVFTYCRDIYKKLDMLFYIEDMWGVVWDILGRSSCFQLDIYIEFLEKHPQAYKLMEILIQIPNVSQALAHIYKRERSFVSYLLNSKDIKLITINELLKNNSELYSL